MGVAEFAFRQDLDASPAVRRQPGANQIRRQRLDGHWLRIEAVSKLVEVNDERWYYCSSSLVSRGSIGLGETRQQTGNVARGIGGGPRRVSRSF